MTSAALNLLSESKVLGTGIPKLVYDTFRSNRLRFVLIALGMIIGTACVILVVTIGMTGKQYAVKQIESIGTNMIDAEYLSGGEDTQPDRLTIGDLEAVRQRVFGVTAASPVLPMDTSIPIGGGKERDIRVLGVFPEYQSVRRAIVLSGRFFDSSDERQRNKVAVLHHTLAATLYGSVENSIGKTFLVNGLPFTVIGTFEESVDTFGQSEVTDNSVLIPYAVARYFTDSPEVDQLYFSAADAAAVAPTTEEIRRVIESRHRPESNYIVQNLTALITLANRTGNALTVVLLLIACVTLAVSGIGVMNIMLVTVNSRIREIGIRKAVGARSGQIKRQFLAEAILISLIGGIAGALLGAFLPLSLRFMTHYRIPVSGVSVIVAIAISAIVGILFGTVPAARAARLDPVQSMRCE